MFGIAEIAAEVEMVILGVPGWYCIHSIRNI